MQLRMLFVLILIALPTLAHAEMYELYGTREPKVGGPFVAAEGAASTNEEAAWIYQCGYESNAVGIASMLYLIEGLSVQVGLPGFA